MDRQYSHNEKVVIAQIKNLTRSRAYGNVVIVIRAGQITAIQVTQDIRTSPPQMGDNSGDDSE